ADDERRGAPGAERRLDLDADDRPGAGQPAQVLARAAAGDEQPAAPRDAAPEGRLDHPLAASEPPVLALEGRVARGEVGVDGAPRFRRADHTRHDENERNRWRE